MTRALKLLATTMLLLATGFVAKAATGITLDTSTANQITVGYADGIYTITTTGTDPYIVSAGLPSALHVADYKLEFQYQASADIDDLQLFFMSPSPDEAKSLHVKDYLKKTDQWVTASVNIANPKRAFSWGSAGQKLRMDFGGKKGVTLKIRYLGVNGSYNVSDTEKNNDAVAVAKYLSNNYPSSITNVSVTTDKVTISGEAFTSGKLVEAPLYANLATMKSCVNVANVNAGSFEITLDRYTTYGGQRYDRLLSRWAVTNNAGTLHSHGRYADSVTPIRSAEPGVLKSKKGLGGAFSANLSDFDPLGIHCVTLNLMLNELMYLTPNANMVKHEYCGKTYYIDPARLNYYDGVIKHCYERGIVVCGILLVGDSGGDAMFAAAMCHPEHSGGYYTLPDVTDIDGVLAYGAIIDFLANRYSQPGNGRIHHWIMHNEVDQHYIWTNMGATQPMARFVDHYERSMRLVSQIVSQYDQNAYVLPSFTSSWCKTHGGEAFATKPMLEQMLAYSNAEGDFRWGIAAHPYPISFFKPRFWSQDTEATYAENSGYSTFKNIEVISNWILRREHYYKNQEKRMLFFTENGVNSIDLTDANLKVQAAGAAWAWKKVVKNAGVDGVMWHNWFDHPTEAADGLRLGLRDNNLNAKPAWYVWQAAGTSTESSVLDPYRSTIGITDWKSIHQSSIATDGSESTIIKPDLSTVAGMTCTLNSSEQVYNMTCTSDDPQVITVPLAAAISSVSNTLAFDYKSDRDLYLQIFFGNAFQEKHSVAPLLRATAGEWKRVYVNIASMRNLTGWGAAGSKLRIDPGSGWTSSNKCNFQMRHLCVNSGEVQTHSRLNIVAQNANQCTLTSNTNLGEHTIVTSGTDPNVYTAPLSCNLAPEAGKLIFEYQASADIPNFMVYFYDNATEFRTARFGTLQASTTWKRAVLDMTADIAKSGWGFEGDYLRIDPGAKSGVTFKVRALRVADDKFVETLPLTLDNRGANDLSLSRDIDSSANSTNYNGWVANTTGTDPYFVTNPLSANLQSNAKYLHIIYKSSADIGSLELFFLEPQSAARSKSYAGVMPATSEWKHIVVPIADQRNSFGWGYEGDMLRVDPGNKVGTNLQIKSMYISDSDSTSDAPIIEKDDLRTPGCTFTTTNGGILVAVPEPRTIVVWNMLGARVAEAYVESSTFIPLPPGIYIADKQKLMVR